jgi:putative tryptophan/tyrosine transport system substrate-binding protein
MAIYIRRRELIVVLGSAAATWPLGALAQQADRVRRIVAILPYPESDPQSQARATIFRARLQELGWLEGQNIRLDFRWDASNLERIRAYAVELLGEKPDIILANSTPVVAALLEEKNTAPIVFVSVSDPVGQRFVASFARPAGNVTGFTNLEPSMGSKWVEMLKEIAPATKRAALILHPDLAPFNTDLYARSIQSAGASLAIATAIAPVRDAAEIEAVITNLGSVPGGGLLVMLDTFVTRQRKLIMSLTTRYRLPAVWPVPFFAQEGGLIAYGANIADLFRRAAPYVDRILRGEKPADLPVQAPTNFELIINLKTAKALGLTVPPTLLIRADEVIE